MKKKKDESPVMAIPTPKYCTACFVNLTNRDYREGSCHFCHKSLTAKIYTVKNPANKIIT